MSNQPKPKPVVGFREGLPEALARWSRVNYLPASDHVVVRWVTENINDIIWAYNTALSTVACLGILLNMLTHDFTLGSMLIDVLVLVMFPVSVLLWEVMIYYGEHHSSMVMLSVMFVMNVFSYVVIVYVLSKLWHWYPYAESRVIFSMVIIVAYTCSFCISGVFLYWKMWTFKWENTLFLDNIRSIGHR